MKNPTIAALLNIIPGVGYLYVGRKSIFAILLILGLVFSVTSSYLDPRLTEYYASAEFSLWDWFALLGLLSAVRGFMYDGYQEAEIYNSRVE
jgi:choline-glycine betaine transporter